MPTKIYCDNATNFVGASWALNELHEAFAAQKEDLVRYAAERKVQFSFIPPRAPNELEEGENVKGINPSLPI